MTHPPLLHWRIEARDALVFARSPRTNDLHGHATPKLPLPSTLAAAVRAHLVGHRDDLDDAAAGALLDVHVRGPWLWRGETVMLPAPLDVRRTRAGRLVRGDLPTPTADEGLWRPAGSPPGVTGLDFGTEKSEALDGFFPLDVVVSWLLGGTADAEGASLHDETRAHVRIDPLTQTAEAGLLYTTPGVRFPEGWSLGVEVSDPARRRVPERGLFMLGGESRVAMRRSVDAGFPDFASVRARYEEAAKREPRGLRIMLLTPGCFGGSPVAWLPAWLASGRGRFRGDLPALTLAAYVGGPPEPVTGWNLRARRARALRRAVPAGSVYRLTLDDATRGDPGAVVALCEALWGASLDTATPARPDALLAAPHADGFGLVIPGLE